MGNLLLKLKVWSKVGLFAVLTLTAVLFVWKNSGREVQVWFFGDKSTSVMQLLVFTCLFSVIGTLLALTATRTLRQIRELRQVKKAQQDQRDLAEMKAKAGMLQTRPAESAEKPKTEDMKT